MRESVESRRKLNYYKNSTLLWQNRYTQKNFEVSI